MGLLSTLWLIDKSTIRATTKLIVIPPQLAVFRTWLNKETFYNESNQHIHKVQKKEEKRSCAIITN